MLEGADLTAPEGLRLTLLSPARSGVSGHQPVTASPAHLTLLQATDRLSHSLGSGDL